jgi:hypothetical protein
MIHVLVIAAQLDLGKLMKLFWLSPKEAFVAFLALQRRFCVSKEIFMSQKCVLLQQ